MNNLEQNKALFKEIVANTIHRDGINDLMNWLETSDFYEAPSSARYHGAEPGGLCAHSLGVYNRLKALQDGESDESIAVVSLFHDLCKVNFYKVSMRNTKDENGRWVQVPYYEFRDWDTASVPLGHGEKSLYMIMKYLKVTDEEACAVRWHMSGYYCNNPSESVAISHALISYRLVLKLQYADQQSAFWDLK
jgi:hypothetical protein